MTLGKEKQQRSAHTVHSTFQHRRGRQPGRSPRPGASGTDREAAGPRPQGSDRRVRQATMQTPRSGQAASPPPQAQLLARRRRPPSQLLREEEATQLITGYVNARGKERVSVRLPAGRAVSPSLCRALAAPAHLRRAPGRRRGRRDGRYGTRPPLTRRVALGRGAGRAQQAGGLQRRLAARPRADPRGQETPS